MRESIYYRFSGDVWERWFNSDVQYINRIQRSEWLSKFESAGLDCIYEDLIEKPHGVRTIHPSYEHLPLSDLNVTNQIVVLRKPG